MSNKKKIGIIGLKGLPAYGGGASVGENIILQLKDRFDFVVYSVSSHTDLSTGYYNGYKQIVMKRIPFKRLNTLWYYIKSVLHALFVENYDLVHLHHRDAAFLIPLLQLKYKVILTTHGSFTIRDKWKKYRPYFRFQEKCFVKKADIVTCVSKNERRLYKKYINLLPKYIPNGISSVDTNHLPDIGYSDYIFFGAGRIIPSKGCDKMLAALQKINYPGKILIAGDFNQVRDYRKKIFQLAKNLDVVFLGLIKDKKLLLSYLYYSKLFIFPSNQEAMSMMLLEAASAKCRIICSDIIQNRDIFTHNEVLFFKTDNVNDLARKITFALNNNNKMNNKAENIEKKLDNEYLWPKIAMRYQLLYK